MSREGAPGPLVPKTGDVLKIHEDNYRFGVGELVLRVTEARSVQGLPDGDWLDVTGVQIAWNGTELGEREVLVRLSSLATRRGRP